MSETWNQIHSDMAAEAAGQHAAAIRERCRCNCPTSDHTLAYTPDTWTEPGGIEFCCNGACGDACGMLSIKRRRCGACGVWANADDVVVLEPLEGAICPACGEHGEMEPAE